MTSHSERACAELLGRVLRPPEELLQALAPGGWENSPLCRIFHPTPDQLRSERERWRRGLRLLSGAGESGNEAGLDDSAEGEPSKPIRPEREVVDLVGLALWDVFSDNHSVIDPDGVEFDLGSFRASAAFISEAMEVRYPALGPWGGYLDFFMGTALVRHRADLLPLYRWIFERLREAGCDWRYSFPRLYLVQLEEDREESFQDYDPSEAIRAEHERSARAEEIRALSADLERDYRAAVEEARFRALPRFVEAYRQVYGALPLGWPHADM